MNGKHLQAGIAVMLVAGGLIGYSRIAIADSTDASTGRQVEHWPETILLEIDAEFETLARELAAWKQDEARRVQLTWQTFRSEALLADTDRDPVDIVLRRTAALLHELQQLPEASDLAPLKTRLQELQAKSARTAIEDPARWALFGEAARLRRAVAFSNPLLDFDQIVFLKRHALPGTESKGHHMCQQYFGFHAVPGGGVFALQHPFGDRPTPVVRNLLANSICRNGRLAGRRLTPGSFISLALTQNGRSLLFAYTEAEPSMNQWTETTTYHLFRCNLDGTNLRQLTDGDVNDFDPCELPDGRIAFISERRKGFGRCHPTPKPNYTLHAMDADGQNIVRLSVHESNEWQPSLDHHGMILYTRWDYVDRGAFQAHHPWITSPHGRDARAIQGNYGRTWENRPLMEMNVRAIPESQRLIATAAAHHGQFYGSLVVIDPRCVDDGAMSAVRRLTPDVAFPESEPDGRPAYATAWPLSENFYLCVYDANAVTSPETNNLYGIYLVDAFGNRELLYRDPTISSLVPMPLRSSTPKPVIPAMKPFGNSLTTSDSATAPVGVINVYNSLKAWPKDTSIKALRIVQVLPKSTWRESDPRIGHGFQKGARAVLGTIPVESDGSAYFELPVDIPVYFQVLDQRGMAVQSMRSDTYTHRGQTLICQGCHEPRHQAPPSPSAFPLAMRRRPSVITPEVDGSNPFSYPRLVQPILNRHCVDCHDEHPKAMDLSAGDFRSDPDHWFRSYRNLKDYAFYFDYLLWNEPRTTPGQFGARPSRLMTVLDKGHYDVQLTDADRYRLTLWLDCNSDFFGSYGNTLEQAEGKVVQPTLH